MAAIIVIVIVIVLAVLFFIFAFNGAVRLRNRVDSAWSQISVQLQRRHDLIPNLIETVKGYAAHESSTLEAVTAARTNAVQAQQAGPAQQAQAENVLTGALRQLFALSESYPDLKANQNFLSLQGELSDTENKIQAARRFYNGNVRDLNTALQVFPGNLIASIFHFESQKFFELDEADAAAREPVAVKF